MPLLRSERRNLLKFGPSLTPAATSTPAIPHCTIMHERTPSRPCAAPTGRAPGTEKSVDPNPPGTESNFEPARSVVTELLSELTHRGRQLAEAKARGQAQLHGRSSRVSEKPEDMRSQRASGSPDKGSVGKGKQEPRQRAAVAASPKISAKKKVCARCGRPFTATAQSKNKKVCGTCRWCAKQRMGASVRAFSAGLPERSRRKF
jgi:ribosomal protein S27AE